MSVLDKLTEGIQKRSLAKEGAALIDKWERTGLLEGLTNDQNKNTMARLLENQAAQLLKESTSGMESGNVEGFASVAFPIVRRVFGGLIANDLVSVQPMSLPSGLIFFMDFTFGSGTDGGNVISDSRGGSEKGDSLYGGNVVGAALTGGVDLGPQESENSFYNLGNGYASPTGSTTFNTDNSEFSGWVSGTYGGPVGFSNNDGAAINVIFTPEESMKLCRFDPDLVSGTSTVVVAKVTTSALDQLNKRNLQSIVISGTSGPGAFGDGSNNTGRQARRLAQFSGSSLAKLGTDETTVLVYAVDYDGKLTSVKLSESLMKNGIALRKATHAQTDDFTTDTNKPGMVVGQTAWGLEAEEAIPEIDIKVDSIAVTAVTKKLKAKWTPELGQDLNAYHNLDAEVELTSILSEQIALEIDREILEDLIKGATAGTYYWSRSPGLFVNRTTGAEIGATSAAPDFTGTVSEWYETLIETINDVSAQIHRKTLRGGANFVVCSPEVANILEFTAGFRANVTHDADRGDIGAQKVGSLSKKFDVYVDPYFPRNVVLIGRKGGSFLESGYVYAPYVPLQVTPTIFGVEDFVPRKGVMTRYAKKMVRPDMYGLVIVRGLLGEAGA
jgi:hypothetical protein